MTLARLNYNGRGAAVAGVVASGGGGGGGGGSGPAALSDITWTQAYPIHPNATDAGDVGWLEPVNGIGPYKFSFTVANASGGNDTGNYAFRGAGRNLLSIFGASPGTVSQTLTATCVDGRGATITRSFPIARASISAQVITINQRNSDHNDFNDGVYNQAALRVNADGGTHSRDTDQFVVTGIGGGSVPALFNNGGNFFNYSTAPPTAGSYGLSITARDSAGNNPITLNYTRVFTNYTPITYIEFIPGIVSTSMTTGSVVGRACATTPNNAPFWALADATGTFGIDTSGKVSTKKTPTSTGPISITITVTDVNASFSATFTINVVAGVTLDPSAMTLTPNTTLTNGTGSVGQVVASPTVTGVTGTKMWSLVQENFNIQAIINGSVNYLFAINPSTGVVTVNGLLMAKTHSLSVSCTDGINTCTKPFSLVVAWAPTTRTVYVGRGMAALHGADGFEQIIDCRKQLNLGARASTTQVYLYADTDDDYYADDTGVRTSDYNGRFAWNGPIIVTGVAASGKLQPRTGGYLGKWSNTGSDMRGKGFWVFGDGDAIFENIEVSHCFGSDQTHGIEAIRKDGETYGNLTIRNSRINNSDNGIETGFGASDITVYGCEIAGCGTSHVSAGAAHNFYIGSQWSALIHDNYSVMAMTGHDFKCRAIHGKVYNNRFYDLERGGASNCINLPDCGDYEVYNNKIQKGTMAQNPYVIQYGEDGSNDPNYQKNVLNLHDNIIVCMTMDGSHYGTPAIVQHWTSADYYGDLTHIDVTNNSCWMVGGGHANLLRAQDWASPGALTLVSDARTTASGNTPLTLPPALDFTRPYLTGTMPRFGWYRTVTEWTGDDFSQYNGNQIDLGVDDLVISHTTSTGALLSVMSASCQLDDNAGTPTNPFVSGTTWQLSTDDVYYGYMLPSPWATQFAVTANSNGTANLTLAGTIAAGVYYIQPKATAPNGTIVKNRFYVIVT